MDTFLLSQNGHFSAYEIAMYKATWFSYKINLYFSAQQIPY